MTEKTNPSVPEEQVSAAEDMNNQTPGGAPAPEPETATEPADQAQTVITEPEPAEETAPEPAATQEEVNLAETEESDATAEPAAAAVDFSDEEAELAADAPEFDLGDDEHEEETAHESHAGPDLSEKSKAELLEMFASLLESRPVQSIRREVEAIKVAFYKLHRADVDAQRKAFVEGGGAEEEFVPQSDAQELRLKELFAEYRKRRDDYLSNIERAKEDNLQVKLRIIDELKELVNSSETMNNTFNAFRDLQNRWKEAGPVPQANVKDLWETYNLHVENFYNFIKINKELRDLDLKKNYEAKMALCEEAEALILEPSVVTAFHKLQKLHEQWRETGPVANEYKETLWDRFREASSRINKQHQEHFDKLKDEQKANLDMKTELCVKAEELTGEVMTTHKEWNRASEKLLEIQKIWKTIGFAPKKDNARVYERFRTACDGFFEQKRNYYLQSKAEMEHNLQLKTEICETAESLRESEEWKKTTDEIIRLQKQWKEIGPVPRRHSDAVWKRFRAACDRFFERKSGHFGAMDSEYESNLTRKRELLAEIEQCDVLAGGFEAIKELQRRWSEIGFVPIKQKDAIQKEYKAVMDRKFAELRGSDQSRRMERYKDRVSTMKSSGGKGLRSERERLYNKVRQLESDIALLENNIGFFSKSKNAEAMIKDVRDKIERTREEMTATVEKINLIDNQQ